MLTVTLGQGSPVAVFRDRYADGFVVDLHADGLTATVDVYMYNGADSGSDLAALAAYFEDLAENWRGWSGEKVWQSLEGHLRIVATHDPLGHCRFEMTVRDSIKWSAHVGGFVFGVGAELSALASDVRRWADG